MQVSSWGGRSQRIHCGLPDATVETICPRTDFLCPSNPQTDAGKGVVGLKCSMVPSAG